LIGLAKPSGDTSATANTASISFFIFFLPN
jgi:hypothetical protein